MRKMKETAPGTWLVWDEPMPLGKTPVSGAAVYQWRSGDWSCGQCGGPYYGGTVGGFPPVGSTVPACDHIDFVRHRLLGPKQKNNFVNKDNDRLLGTNI